jgi:hypothetical protein
MVGSSRPASAASNNRMTLTSALVAAPPPRPSGEYSSTRSLSGAFGRPMTPCNVVWIGVFLLILGFVGCERRSSEIDYRGERIKLTKSYADFDDYKNDPENIDPSATERVQRLVLGAPIAKTFGSRLRPPKR